MSLDLPKTSKEMRDWKWNNYEPFFEYLLNQEIDAENIESWMKYWSDFSELIGEVGTDVYVSTTVDTTDKEAKKRFHTFLEDISENASTQNQALKKKLLETGFTPNNFEIPLRSIKSEVELFCEDNLPLMTKDSKVLIDCGFNPGNEKEPSPFLSSPEVTPLEGIDAVVLTHAHLDHSALLPMLFVYGYDGPIYCTPPTRELSSLLQNDFIKIQNAEGKRVPYNTEHIRQAIRNTIPLNYGDTTDVSPDLKLTFHNSGHILGSAAAHFHVGDGLYNLVFSGDIKFENTWLFDRAVNHFPRLEALIMESTYGGYNDFQPPRDEGTRNLTEIINRTVEKKGKIIIPVFAVGRSQEVMLVLEKAFSEGKLQDTPVYLDGMIWEATALHSAYPEYLNNNLRNKIYQNQDNPFRSEIFNKVESVEMRQQICGMEEPAIVLATSGMVNGGPVMEYIRHWAPEPNNTMVFVGYQASGTMGQRLQQGANEIHLHDRENGGMVPVKVNMNLETCEGFSGHSDKRQLMRYLRTIRPRPKIVLLNHGDAQKCEQFANDIRRKVRLDARVPHNLETIRFM